MIFFEGDNIGGIQKLEVAHQAYFTGFNPATLAAGKAWAEIPFIPQSAQLQMSEEDSANGTIYEYNLTFAINRVRMELFEQLNIFVGSCTVFRITDMNDDVYIIGAPGYPCTLAATGNTGAQYTDANGMGYKVKNEQPFRFFRA